MIIGNKESIFPLEMNLILNHRAENHLVNFRKIIKLHNLTISLIEQSAF